MTAGIILQGSHPVPWQAAPASMDLRGKSSEELCQMAKDPGTIASDVRDHLLGDPLILWAVEGGQLPQPPGTTPPPPNTDPAFGNDWAAKVDAWINGGMQGCP